jgi:hypothetical protein
VVDIHPSLRALIVGSLDKFTNDDIYVAVTSGVYTSRVYEPLIISLDKFANVDIYVRVTSGLDNFANVDIYVRVTSGLDTISTYE